VILPLLGAAVELDGTLGDPGLRQVLSWGGGEHAVATPVVRVELVGATFPASCWLIAYGEITKRRAISG
jgi:hypothetical protein